MPASKPSKSSEPSGTNESADADEAVTDPAAEDEAVPANRAERRAKKHKSGGVPTGHSALPGRGSSTFQGPRQWSNRRGGG
jgi:hypothetical protein